MIKFADIFLNKEHIALGTMGALIGATLGNICDDYIGRMLGHIEHISPKIKDSGRLDILINLQNQTYMQLEQINSALRENLA